MLLQACAAQCAVSGRGRVSAIADDGALHFADGSVVALPWGGEESALEGTTYVHCTSGAFNFGLSAAETPLPVFASDELIRVQAHCRIKYKV